MRRRAVLALLLLSAALGACDRAPQARFQLTDVTGAPFGKALALTGHDGKSRTLDDFRGKVVVIFFGFLHCPDVCPTTLAELAQVAKALGPDAARLQVLFVTVDPERDTPELLRHYVTSFHPDFLGLRGDGTATTQVAKEFKMYFEKRPGASPGAYTVDHSAQTYVLDPQGRLRLFVRHGRIAEDLAPDLRVLLR